ncbi:MAG: glutamate 5-kinase, partial [Armatimonadota bacterium]|nr:glutamate 5-kinase [Armatimonadota bacterium]
MSFRRVVVKVGSSTLTGGTGVLDEAYVEDLVRELARAREQGVEVLLVTSGAIAVGAARLRIERLSTIPEKQAAAGVGQGLLMGFYIHAFNHRRLAAAQVLLTHEDLSARQRYLNARNALFAMLRLGAVPVINENDTVAVDEIRVGENDTLAAMVAGLVDADLLVLLSDVEGLLDPEGRLVEEVRDIGLVMPFARGSGSRLGTGGMVTKLHAAQMATRCGAATVIANGRREGVLTELLQGGRVGTFFPPQPERLPGRKRWIAFGARARGALIVNDGARASLVDHGKSLLPAGIVGVEGTFQPGDLVCVRDEAGREIARGLSNYTSEEVSRIRGLRTDQVAALLGALDFEEVIHR